jgi:predicted RNA-binding protein with PUA-like domain
MASWLMKSEPDVYGIRDLERDGTTHWEGVRNFQARNYLRAMALGDDVLFYHSVADPLGVAGVCRVVGTAGPDPTQHDPASPYHDPTAPKDGTRWSWVQVAFVERFPAVVTLAAIKADPQLATMEVARRGSRLSVHPVDDGAFRRVVAIGRRSAP